MIISFSLQKAAISALNRRVITSALITPLTRANKAQSEELSSYSSPAELPEGSLHFQDFLAQHNLKQHRRHIAGYLDAPRNGLQFELFPGRTDREKERYLTPAQQEALIEWLTERHGELFKPS